MKSFLQIAVPVLLVAGVVGVIAYTTANTARSPKLPEIQIGQTKQSQGDAIAFDDDPTETDNARPMEVEYPSHQHKDFWFHAAQDRDAMIGLWHKSCGCANVELGSFNLSDAEWEEIAATPSPAALCRLMNTLTFDKLPETQRNQHATIKAAAPGKTPKPYVLRVNWDVKPAQDANSVSRLGVQVNVNLAGGTPQIVDRTIPFVIVSASGVWPISLDIGDLNPGGRVTKEVVVWSQTRDRLEFTARVTASGDAKANEPCAVIGPPRKLTEPEVAEFARQLTGPDPKIKLKPHCAYRFPVTLHERLGENQLEMGPLARRLIIKFQKVSLEEEPLADLKTNFAAYVSGEVRVLNGDEVGRVDFGTFKFDRVRQLDVRLGSTDPKLELEVESCSHEKMHVRLSDPMVVEGRREWVMHIDIEPNALLGKIVEQVVLRVKGNPNRKLRIPINGNAER